MNIKVKSKHIRAGKQAQSNCCPVALALKDSFKTDNVRVFWSWAYINNQMYDLPKKVTKFINDFDKKKSSVKSIEFSL